MAQLRIPQEYHNGVAKLTRITSLSEAALEELVSLLSSLAPSLYRRTLPLDSASRIVGISPDDASEIGEALYGLSLGRMAYSVPADQFAEDVTETIEKGAVEGASLSSETRELFKDRLARLLDTDTLKAGAKALELVFEQEHTLVGARILTDIRPVFGESVEEPPVAAFIVHNLRITFRQAAHNGEFFVAMDANDLDTLIDLFQRAKTKAEVLKSVLAAAKVRYIEAG